MMLFCYFGEFQIKQIYIYILHCCNWVAAGWSAAKVNKVKLSYYILYKAHFFMSSCHPYIAAKHALWQDMPEDAQMIHAKYHAD